VGAGLYKPDPARLQRLRAAIDDARTGRQIQRIVAALGRKRYDVASHETLSSAPRGYDRSHPRLELLQMKDIHAGRLFAPAPWLSTAGALERINRVMADTGPLVAWLQQHVPAEDGKASTGK
jgi:uncharacterized protein (DUF2461 family)